MKFILLTPCFLLILLADFSIAQKVNTGTVLLTTDTTEYSTGVSVTLTIKNVSKNTISFYQKYFSSLLMERWENDKWVEADFRIPIDGKLIVEPLAPGQSKLFEWKQWVNQKDNWPKTVDAPKGTYRFKLIFWKRSDIPNPQITIGIKEYREYLITYSNEFAIKN